MADRQQVVHQRRIEQLALFVEDELLVERVADAVRDAALDLALDNHRIDHAPQSWTTT